MSKDQLLLNLLKSLLTKVEDGYWKECIVSETENFDKKFIQATEAEKIKYLQNLTGLCRGGMGSLPDEIEFQNQIYLDNLYKIIETLLRDLSFNPEATNYIPRNALFSVGQLVELVEGEVWVVDLYGVEKTVPEQSHLREKKWVVSGLCPPDITNTPVYTLTKWIQKTVFKSNRFGTMH